MINKNRRLIIAFKSDLLNVVQSLGFLLILKPIYIIKKQKLINTTPSSVHVK